MLATALVEEKIINYRTIVRLHLCSCQSQQSVDSKECHYQNSWIQKQSAWNANIPPDLCKKFIRGAGGVGGGVGVISVTKHTQQMSWGQFSPFKNIERAWLI